MARRRPAARPCPIAADVPSGLRELPELPPAGRIGVHLVVRDGLADTVTRTATSMLSAFLAAIAWTTREPRHEDRASIGRIRDR
jgi:hypothetical protein